MKVQRIIVEIFLKEIYNESCLGDVHSNLGEKHTHTGKNVIRQFDEGSWTETIVPLIWKKKKREGQFNQGFWTRPLASIEMV